MLQMQSSDGPDGQDAEKAVELPLTYLGIRQRCSLGGGGSRIGLDWV